MRCRCGATEQEWRQQFHLDPLSLSLSLPLSLSRHCRFRSSSRECISTESASSRWGRAEESARPQRRKEAESKRSYGHRRRCDSNNRGARKKTGLFCFFFRQRLRPPSIEKQRKVTLVDSVPTRTFWDAFHTAALRNATVAMSRRGKRGLCVEPGRTGMVFFLVDRGAALVVARETASNERRAT